MYESIFSSIETRLQLAKQHLEWDNRDIKDAKKDLLDATQRRKQTMEDIEQFELFLIENGRDPNKSLEVKE